MKKNIDVSYVAQLARIKLDPNERDLFAAQFDGILSYIEKLDTIDTRTTEPTSHVVPLKNVLREDVITPSLDPAAVLMNAPQADGSFFRVPKVVHHG